MFGHLQIYSCYSFQESTILIEDLCQEAASLHLSALALTDKNTMHGAVEFTQACHKYHIKPIYGLEASISIENEIYPFLLLAKNTHGYHELVKISSHICLSDEKCILFEELSTYHDIYVLTPGSSGIIERLILKELYQEAHRYLSMFKNTFKERFYVCLSSLGLALQDRINQQLIEMAQKLNIPCVCSNQVSYLKKEDALTLDLLEASRVQKVLPLNYQPQTHERYLKSEAEMQVLFSQEIIDHTCDLVEKCQASILTDQLFLPNYPLPKEGSSKDYLTQLCRVGLQKRFKGKQIPQKYIDRLKHELKIIIETHFEDYFLIVYDYVHYAKTHGILVGAGRGSAVGSLVAYVLGITNVDPLVFDLLFERFLNPERISWPDIDIDFQDNRRDEVVDYVISRYGKDHVAQICTFNTYGPKVAIKDLGKVVGIPLPQLERISKMVPTAYKNKKTAKQVYQESAQFQIQVRKDPGLSFIMPSVFTVEKLPRNISTHAAGVILSSKPLDEIVPLTLGPTTGIVTQYSKDDVEKAGLLKMDFLGLRNLTIMDYVIKDMARQGVTIDLAKISFENEGVYRMLAAGDTFGIFQLESEGMISLLKKMKVSCFDDIVAAIALFRPGPMENIPSYLARKHHLEPIGFIPRGLKEVLEPTYGIMIYQEQIMQVTQIMAGFTLGKADILRKAVSKKQTSLMMSLKEEFIQGSIKNGYTSKEAEDMFALIEKFANYGFNKAHSVGYSYIAYQMAYLKYHYPIAFFAALLSNEQASSTNKLHCIQEGKKRGFSLLPPSVNYSNDRFQVEGKNIRYSLLAIKNVGYAACKEILAEREEQGLFKDIYDFFGRMQRRKLSSKMIESLVDAGAFDEFNLSRATIKANLTELEDYAELRNSIGIEDGPILKEVNDSSYQRLEKEKEVLGIYLSTHPIALIKKELTLPVVDIVSLPKKIHQRVTILVNIQRVKTITDKKGQVMGFISGQDDTGMMDGVIFSNVYGTYQSMLKRGNICILEGKVDMKTSLSFIVEKVDLYEGRDI